MSGANKDVGSAQMAVWDPVASRLYPLVPGRFAAKWRRDYDRRARAEVDKVSVEDVIERLVKHQPAPAK